MTRYLCVSFQNSFVSFFSNYGPYRTSTHIAIITSYLSNSRVLLMILTHETWICCIVRVFLMKKNYQMITEVTEPVKLYVIFNSVQYNTLFHDVTGPMLFQRMVYCVTFGHMREKNLKPSTHGWKNYDGCHDLCSISLIICEKENKD